MFNCACVYEFCKVHIIGTRRFYFVGALLFHDNVHTHLGGASIREGASNRDITVVSLGHNELKGKYMYQPNASTTSLLALTSDHWLS